MRARYDDIIRMIKQGYGVRVRRWRRQMSGAAWRVEHPDGRVINWIESPRPRSPLSLAIFLHEVGHHVLGFDRYDLRCEDEYHAWKFAVDTMRRLGIEPDTRTKRRVLLSMQYAVQQSVRRGLKLVPPKFHEYHRIAA